MFALLVQESAVILHMISRINKNLDNTNKYAFYLKKLWIIKTIAEKFELKNFVKFIRHNRFIM